jgi:hypothetical protein
MSDKERSQGRDWAGEEPLPLPVLPPGEPAGRQIDPIFHLGPSPLESAPAEAEEPAAAPAPEPRPAPVIRFQERKREPEAEKAAETEPYEEEEEPVDPRPGPEAAEPPRARASSPAGELYSESFFDQEDDEPFELPGTEKLGIIGGKEVGKSFLFQSMVYRTYSKPQAGALSSYIDKTRLFHALTRKDKAQSIILSEFGKKYMAWERLPTTLYQSQRWYRLRLHYKTGILGRNDSAMDVEFFDGSGEAFFEAARSNKGIRERWREGYLDARVMVFCLPIWAAFPGDKMNRKDWKTREDLLAGLERVIANYESLRTEGKRTQPVKSILALTMADDQRSALKTLHRKWIAPYMDNPQLYLRQLRSGAGVARYLANARAISEAVHEEMAASRDQRVSAIPQKLEFGSRPWMIPLSAVEGSRLAEIEHDYPNPDDRPVLPAPVPVHVELPLLVALCERHNALM